MTSMPDDDVLSSAIEAMFPEGVIARASIDATVDVDMAFERGVATARLRQHAQHLSGRRCARDALTALGVSYHGVPVGLGGAPVWSNGTVGSIAHCNGMAVAAVAHRHQFTSLGIDVEAADREVPDAVDTMLCMPGDEVVLGDLATPFLGLLCMKEAAFKTLWPLGLHAGDFTSIITRREDDSRFRAAGDVTDSVVVHGRLGIVQDFLVAAAWIRASSRADHDECDSRGVADATSCDGRGTR